MEGDAQVQGQQRTNLQALIDAQNTASLPNTCITLVLANRKAAYGLVRASTANPPIPTAYLALKPFLKANPGKTRDDYDEEIARLVTKQKPDLVILAGWMHVFGDRFLDVMSGAKAPEGVEPIARPIPVINLHPALPGAFDGAHAIDRAFELFQKGGLTHSGVMVHRVVKEVDQGEPIIVRDVPFFENDTLEAFEERMHKAEWEIIVKAAAKVLDDGQQVGT